MQPCRWQDRTVAHHPYLCSAAGAVVALEAALECRHWASLRLPALDEVAVAEVALGWPCLVPFRPLALDEAVVVGQRRGLSEGCVVLVEQHRRLKGKTAAVE